MTDDSSSWSSTSTLQSPEFYFSVDGPSRSEHFEMLGRKYDASHPTLHPVDPDLLVLSMPGCQIF